MNAIDLAVAAGGVAAILWVNWYFLAAAGSTASAATVSGVQQATIRVSGGYDPALVTVRRDVPLRLVFDRQENSSCSEDVVIGAFGIRRHLPAFQRTTIEFTPDKAGRFDITCGMSMLHATLVVEDA